MDELKMPILERLKHSVQLLASAPEVQLQLLPPFVCKADELALEFDHWWEVTRNRYGADLGPDQQSSLRALDEKLAWLTKRGKEEWTDHAVRESHEWQEIRSLAARVLNTFGWPMETPPSHADEYVPGIPPTNDE